VNARGIFVTGAVSAFVGVAAGAFGAHALRDTLAPDLAAVFETGVRYQLVHALALLAVAGAALAWPASGVARSAVLFAAGTVLFSGSLYALALSGVRALGAVTPFGGFLFLAGWLNAAWCVARNPSR
jgi:uncharacterized membrane protein YgdD (TMEM256/DUF423 family)